MKEKSYGRKIFFERVIFHSSSVKVVVEDISFYYFAYSELASLVHHSPAFLKWMTSHFLMQTLN